MKNLEYSWICTKIQTSILEQTSRLSGLMGKFCESLWCFQMTGFIWKQSKYANSNIHCNDKICITQLQNSSKISIHDIIREHNDNQHFRNKHRNKVKFACWLWNIALYISFTGRFVQAVHLHGYTYICFTQTQASWTW